MIREIGAAVVALQEVELHSRDPHALSRATGLVAIPGHTIRADESTYGNLLLTRLPIEEWSLIDLSFGDREPRGLIDVCLRTPGGARLRCLATHLGLARRERHYQHRLLTTLLSGDRRVPTLLMGDFNEWRPFTATIRALNRQLGRSRRPRTFPSRLPLLPLDRIWVDPPHLLWRLYAWRSPLARLASDHLPVVAEFREPAEA